MASQAIPTARTVSPRSSAASGTKARREMGMAPTAYRTSGAVGASRVRSMAVTKVRVPKGCDILWRQRQSHQLVEVRRGLLCCEPQLGPANVDELAARPQPGQRQRGV